MIWQTAILIPLALAVIALAASFLGRRVPADVCVWLNGRGVICVW